jgi:pimeloyl-ACP methyl ester carboxylesterase
MEHARSAYLEALAATSDEELFNYWAGALRTWEAYQGVDYTDRLSELTMPVCIIHGTADDYVPAATALDAHERIPRSELHLVEGADHIGLSMASAAAEALHEWIDRVSGTTARTSARH